VYIVNSSSCRVIPLRGCCHSAGMLLIFYGSPNILKHSERLIFAVTEGSTRISPSSLMASSFLAMRLCVRDRLSG